LLEAHAATAVASAAGLRLGPGRGARTVARDARHDALVAHRLLAPERGLLERDLELVLEVALVALADSEDSEKVAEDAVDGDVADVDESAREGAPGSEGRAGLLGAVTQAVVERATVLVGEHLVGQVDLLEALVGGRVALIAVGMVLGRKLLEGALDLLGCGSSMDSEDLVMVPLRHASTGLSSTPSARMLERPR
jgi:hypothetical protein